jgi:iron complex outermembrane receptor protein
MHSTGKTFGLLGCATLALADAASAQQAESAAKLDEIVVTARRDVERLAEVPASVSVLTSDILLRTGVRNVEQMTNLTPGVTIVTGTAEVGDTQINIRGINGARDAESNVALVVDGILKTNTAQLNQIQGDLQQIEVLKGPQGAFYGRNATAGAIVMTTRKPGDVATGNARLRFAEHATFGGEGTFAGPVTDSLGIVVFGDYRDTDGFYRNTGPNPESRGHTVDRFEGWNVGTRVVYAPRDDFELDFKARYGEVDASALSFNAVFNLPGFAAALGNPDFNEDVNRFSYDFIGNIVPDNRQETTEFSVKLTQALAGGELTAWYLHSDVEQDWIADSTAASFYRFELQPSCTQTRTDLANAGYVLPSPQFLSATPFTSIFGPFGPTTCDGTQFQLRDQQDDSVEIRFASDPGAALRWSLGAYYLNIDRQNGVAIAEDQGQGGLRRLYNPPGTTNPTSLLFNDRFQTDVYAGFGSLQYDPSDEWSLSAALRFDREERDVKSLVPNVLDPATGQPINPGLPATGTIPDKSRTYDEWQPKLSATYKPTPEWTLYANWGIGFKAGGFNNQGSQAVIDNNFNIPLGSNLLVEDEYREETSSSFEVGGKASLLARRLNLELALYHTDVDDMQFFEFFTGPFGLLRTVTNIDDVSIQGAEFNATFQANDYWRLFGAVNVIDSEIERNASRPDTVGNKSPYTAEYTVNLGTQVEIPLSDTLDATVRADWRLTGPTWFHTVQSQDVRTVFDLVFPGLGVANYDRTERDAYDVLDLRVSLDWDRWTAAVFATNLFEEDWIAEVIPAPEFGGAFLAPGGERTIGVEFGVRF